MCLPHFKLEILYTLQGDFPWHTIYRALTLADSEDNIIMFSEKQLVVDILEA